jgi:hypothetical protein
MPELLSAFEGELDNFSLGLRFDDGLCTGIYRCLGTALYLCCRLRFCQARLNSFRYGHQVATDKCQLDAHCAG